MEEYCTLEAMEEVCQDVLCTRFETISIITIYYILRDDTEGDQTVENDHSKTIKTPIVTLPLNVSLNVGFDAR